LIDRIHLVVASGAAIEEDADGITSADNLGKMDIPVDLIRGNETQPVISAIHAALVDRIPNAVDHVIEGANHMVAIDRKHTAAVADIIRAAGLKTA
jgi:pimeloyl-ACP methyl ester carboxylesterase